MSKYGLVWTLQGCQRRALQLPTSPRRREESGMCHFDGTLWDIKGWALSKQEERLQKTRLGNTSLLLTSLFCPALALALIQPLQEKNTKITHKQTEPASAAPQRHFWERRQLHQQVKMSSRCCGEALIQFGTKISCKSSKRDTAILLRVWLCPETTATAALVATQGSRAPAVENKTHSPPLPPHSSPCSLPLKLHLNFSSIQAQYYLLILILISIFTTKTEICCLISQCTQSQLFPVSLVSFSAVQTIAMTVGTGHCERLMPPLCPARVSGRIFGLTEDSCSLWGFQEKLWHLAEPDTDVSMCLSNQLLSPKWHTKCKPVGRWFEKPGQIYS